MKSLVNDVEHVMMLRVSNIGGAGRMSHLPKHASRSSPSV